MELKVLDNKGKESRTVNFDEALIDTKASKSLLHEVVVAHRANQRMGTHGTLTRAEVSGGGQKPWKQKGTGRARSGSTRSPLWRHGGIIFGPTPRDYRQDLPKQKKKLAFRMALQELFSENKFQVVDPIQVSEPKTRLVAQIYSKWQAPTDSLFVVHKKDPVFSRASKNIANVKVTDVESLNTYDCLAARRIFITPEALEQLSARISGKGN
jgi:large subunit ribosomal protein L4